MPNLVSIVGNRNRKPLSGDICVASADSWVSVAWVQRSKEMSLVTCLNCHSTTDAREVLEVCPTCGSLSGILNSINVAGIEIFPCVQLKVENPRYQGRRKYARETKSKAEYSANGQLVRVEQSIDRENDRYRKKVTNVDTGEVLREADHPLTEHTGHGSDKPGRE